MGTQQFGTDTLLLDMTNFNQVICFDKVAGLITVQSGIQWPDLIKYLNENNHTNKKSWTIRQKQTGVDNVSIGGSVAANIHGRGLHMPPIVNDIASFDLLNASGKLITCSRTENSELFSLAIGGYGLFGIMVHITLRLTPRIKVQRIVEVIELNTLIDKIKHRKKEGFIFGDCQYSIDVATDEKTYPGVFSCYKQVNNDMSIDQGKKLEVDDWAKLYAL
jgi:FAD/FMN-containing dehydrogenase